MALSRILTFILIVGAVLLPGPARAAEAPVVRFAVLADVQYGDKDTQGKRRFREAEEKLRACLADLGRRDLAFVMNLGDLIDGNGALSESEFQRMLALFKGLKAPMRHVIGNHCLVIGRPKVMQHLGLEAPFYEFRVPGWRFLVLDGMDVSLHRPRTSENGQRAKEYLAQNPKQPTYNGALSDEQLSWLRERLADTARQGERAVVFCHHPTLTAASNRHHVLWNQAEVLKVLEASGCVAAYINGHDHQGGYAEQNGIHHLTMPAIVEAPEGGNAYAIIELHADRIVVEGTGTAPSRTLPLRPAR